MSNRKPDKQDVEKNGSRPEILPLLNKVVLVLLLLMAVKIFHIDHKPKAEQTASSGTAQFLSIGHVKASHPMTALDPLHKPSASEGSPNSPILRSPARSRHSLEFYKIWIKLHGNTAVRSAPSPDKPVVMMAASGEQFQFLKDSGKWLEIQLDGLQTGWIPISHAEPFRTEAGNVQLVKAKSNTHLYWGPGASFGIAHSIAAGSSLIPERVSGEWVQLAEAAAGKPLWIQADQAVWTAGSPPAKTAFAGEVHVLSVQPANKRPLLGKTIVIDPGHGGKDPGAIAKIKPVKERDVNLSVAQVLEQKLRAAGAHVIMTRTTNDVFVSLADRARISNEHHADAFVSIHQNVYNKDPLISGTNTYYDTSFSKKLADDIEASTVKALHSTEQKDQIISDPLYVLKHNERPAVLVEGCFLSNPQELNDSLLPDYQERLSQGIYDGLLKYFGK